MAIVKADLLAAIASDLEDYNQFTTEAGGFLERQLSKAIDYLAHKKPWPFMVSQATLTTTDGTLGPYNPPTDFDGLIGEKKLHKAYAFDHYAVPPSVPDGTVGQRYPLYYNEPEGKLYFHLNPGSASRVFTYLRKSSLEDLAYWPDEQWLKSLLTYYTAFFALQVTDDFQTQAKSNWDLAELMVQDEYRKIRRGQSRPDSRTPLDMFGNPLWYPLAGGMR